MSKLKNIGKRKVIAWRGAILPGDIYTTDEKESIYLRLLFPGEFQIIEDEPVVAEFKVVEEPKAEEVIQVVPYEIKPHVRRRKK